MTPIDDAIGKHWLEQQLYMMEAQKRVLMSTSAGSNNSVGLAYDAGYLAAITELHAIIFNPQPKTTAEQNEDDFEVEEFEDDDA